VEAPTSTGETGMSTGFPARLEAVTGREALPAKVAAGRDTRRAAEASRACRAFG
jgi:hypothetical protein